MKKESFDHRLADECARAFSTSTGLGCTVSDTSGKILFEHGPGCGSCGLCRAAGLPTENCIRAHHYGMIEAERFGGKYIYFCPFGLTCFVSPIIGEEGSMAKITVGPFMMVELQDFIDCELSEYMHLDPGAKEQVCQLLLSVPQVSPKRVQDLSVLLFMAVGFMNNVSAENRLLEIERSDLLQGQIGAYIAQLKGRGTFGSYPFDRERALLQAVSHGEKAEARQYLTEYLASLHAGGSEIGRIRARISEFLVLLSRTAAANGMEEQQVLLLYRQWQQTLSALSSFQAVSAWLLTVVEGMLESIAAYPDVRHANIIHRCIQHIGAGYQERLTLEDAARMVCLSSDYLSRIFREETGVSFHQYLNNVRITKAKELIRTTNLRLTDISQMVGYDDQSYFTKVFKRTAGIAPGEYMKKYRSSSSQTAVQPFTRNS
ncbi:MAG TPA: AraC family transcriptional regulator [Candidatus Eisenbergiella merdipullorum]|uniref:AraC family transcriptional regulator n=1 Tax=Candidatus Eisenbergiella merdipullorum TaxID=2838553 RepID=A0A9D2I2X5_9FIRM|nr:AraC family transcriptional regulator [Candidatus Eisenbergiella merdipullorum]